MPHPNNPSADRPQDSDRPQSTDRHAIRLRGPWGCAAGSRFDPQQARRVRWASGEDPVELDPAEVDAFVMRRAFNRPTGLTAADRVHLVVEGVEHLRAIECNGQAVWSCEAAKSATTIDVDISETLRAANQLDLIITLPRPAPPHVSGEVRLEIAEARQPHP